MTRFSVASQTLSAVELTKMINRFESTAFDTVAEFGGRVVKLIGDEVLFATDGPRAAADIALQLVDRLEEDPDMPRVRGGLSHGPVVEIQGDVFGETVNLASRLTEVAKSGSVLASESFKEALQGADDLEVRRIKRITMLKGVGRVRAYVLRRLDEQETRDQVVP
jgi:adenylate cyclase